LKILCNVQFKKIFRSVGCWFFSVHCKLKSKKRNLKNILQQKQTRINNCFTKENLKRYVFAIFIIMISYLTKSFFFRKKGPATSTVLFFRPFLSSSFSYQQFFICKSFLFLLLFGRTVCGLLGFRTHLNPLHDLMLYTNKEKTRQNNKWQKREREKRGG